MSDEFTVTCIAKKLVKWNQQRKEGDLTQPGWKRLVVHNNRTIWKATHWKGGMQFSEKDSSEEAHFKGHFEE